VAHDPAVAGPRTAATGDVPCVTTPLEAARGADALIVLTEWPEFAAVDPAEVASTMSGRIVFDARNILDPAAFAALGLDLMSVGRARE
jgi:UDPglucose 6-dehydrogenase